MGTRKHPERVRPFNMAVKKAVHGDANRKSKQKMTTVDQMAKSGKNIRTYGCRRKGYEHPGKN